MSIGAITHETVRHHVSPLTPHEVSLALGVHLNTVKRIPPSELPFFRVTDRGDRRYLPADVTAFIERRTVR